MASTDKPARRRMRGNGEGSAPRKRPDGRWEARYTAGHTPEGKQVRRSVYGATRAEVAEKLKHALVKTERGAIVLAEHGKLTLHDYVSAYHEARQAEVGEGTYLKEKSYVTLVKKRPLGGVLLTDLRPAHLETFYRDLASTHAPGTVRHVRSLINRALRQAVRHDVLTSHPGLVAELPRMERRTAARAIAPEELTRIVAAARDTRHYVLFATMATLGVRHGEALGFQWGDVDWAKGTVQVTRTVVDRNRKAVVSAPKTSASRRTLYLPPALLKLWQGQREALRLAALPTGEDAWVFPSTHGNPSIQRHIREAWEKLLVTARIETHYRIHDLRHTFISRLIESGADPKTAADLAGHTDPRLTLSLYTHTRDETRKRALMVASDAMVGVLDDEKPTKSARRNKSA